MLERSSFKANLNGLLKEEEYTIVELTLVQNRNTEI